MRELFIHSPNNTEQLLPGNDWDSTVNQARAEHAKHLDSRIYPNEEIRAIGSAVAGAAIATGKQVDLDIFANASEPPLEDKDLRDLNWGYRVVTSDDMKGVEL